MAAYLLYAGRVPPLSMQCLIYMALVSMDGDDQPWFGMGHEALAELALGRPKPITESDLRAVRRAIEPLLAEAIEADRRPANRGDGPSTVRYRLNLDVGRKPSSVEGGDVGRFPVATQDGLWSDVGRKPVRRRTETVLQRNKRKKRSEKEEEVVAPSTQVQTAREDTEPAEKIDLAEGEPSGDRAATCSCGVYLDPDGSCFAHPLDKR